MSTSSVRRLEGTRLHPQQDERGVWLFDAAEVDALQLEGPLRQRQASARHREADSAGDLAARVFLMFAQGKELRDIVIVTKQPPERVRALYREWTVGLHEGEIRRRENIAFEQQRREDAEYERAQLAIIRALRG